MFLNSEQEYFRGLSFATISAVGGHAAIVHYEPTPQTNVKITRDEIYIVDSGGQYLDGTTDITRTVHLGEPTPKEIDAFTRVLKGSINMGTAVFPRNAPVITICPLALAYLSERIIANGFSNSCHSSMQWPVVHFGILAWTMVTVPDMVSEHT